MILADPLACRNGGWKRGFGGDLQHSPIGIQAPQHEKSKQANKQTESLMLNTPPFSVTVRNSTSELGAK